jgi:hypothetical protein
MGNTEPILKALTAMEDRILQRVDGRFRELIGTSIARPAPARRYDGTENPRQWPLEGQATL